MGNSKNREVICIRKGNDGKYILEFIDGKRKEKGKESNRKTHVDYYGYNSVVEAVPNPDVVSNLSLKLNKFSGIKTPESMKEKEYTDTVRVLNKYNKEIIDSTKKQYTWLKIVGETLNKLVIGLGGQSVFENDITLHHIHGIPYIPGQAIKGALRNYVVRKYYDGQEDKALEHDFFKNTFGVGSNDGGLRGKVVFLDAYPCDKFTLVEDVITPHYTSYYKGESLPLDNDNPIPIKFLVVKDTFFSFNIGIDKEIVNKEILDHISNNIREILQFEGLGAKTSVGYGYFNDRNIYGTELEE